VVNVNAGESRTFTASYTAGYERNQLLVDGGVVNADTYTFTNVQANHTISLISKATVYSITYHLDGGTGTATGTYTVENEAGLQTPTKEGFTFQGWYDNAGLSGNVISSIPAGSTGNQEFWAKWEAIPEPDPDVHHPVLLYKLTGNQLTVKVVGPRKESFTKLTVDGAVQGSWTFTVQTGRIYEIKVSSSDGTKVIEQKKKFE
jgi:uncharacterized repeat protein (TIGR02543 family)